MLASRYGQQAPFIYDRKETKDHGEGGELIGACELLVPSSGKSGETQQAEGPRVLVVDDVLTSGCALRSGIQKLKNLNPNVRLAALVILLDRQEKLDGGKHGDVRV